MEMLEEFLQYLVRNALIIVAKDGTPLITSGKKAFSLLKKNLVDVIILNKFGDFVLVIGKLFVVLIAGFVGYAVVSVSHREYFLKLFASDLSCLFRKTPTFNSPLSQSLSESSSLISLPIASSPFTKWPSTQFSSHSAKTARRTMEWTDHTTCLVIWWRPCKKWSTRLVVTSTSTMATMAKILRPVDVQWFHQTGNSQTKRREIKWHCFTPSFIQFIFYSSTLFVDTFWYSSILHGPLYSQRFLNDKSKCVLNVLRAYLMALTSLFNVNQIKDLNKNLCNRESELK